MLQAKASKHESIFRVFRVMRRRGRTSAKREERATSRAGIISEGVDAEKERASASDVRINVRVYAMFAGCIISRSGTASKYGRRLAEVRSKP